jgi:hypothetical protein
MEKARPLGKIGKAGMRSSRKLTAAGMPADFIEIQFRQRELVGLEVEATRD